ncbi:MAG: UDP-N-acetylglucosamine 2-epimerase (non-hydrolyzing) [Sphingobacteriaceae bacterium]|nr:UDP-N-acetylglucosamine 2-epimerase (non-hydrolyzing) [Sphingobacteriaceae bacterium]
MKKILTIVGARPQFIKASVFSKLIRTELWKEKFTEVIVHTGQHYDEVMSNIFFNEMGIPTPHYSLSVGGTSNGKMIGRMLIELEEIMQNESPDIVLVYGDTNSTLAGALAAAKLNIKVAHIEAGLRSFWKVMPEEQNRILTDHLSEWLFCPTQNAVDNLKNEGLTSGLLVGDIMYDVCLEYGRLVDRFSENEINGLLDNVKIGDQFYSEPFFLVTFHRAENTDDKNVLSSILRGLSLIKSKGILPLHPRTEKRIREFGLTIPDNLKVISPIGYLEMLLLIKKSSFIVTDSGGLQKEAYFLSKPCVTLRNQTEWVETLELGWNRLAGSNEFIIEEMCNTITTPMSHPDYYGDGSSVVRILSILNLF